MKTILEHVNKIQTEMADSKSIKEIVNQVSVQAVMIISRDSDTALWKATMLNQCENHRQRNEGLELEKLRFNRDEPDRYVELLNFQLEVMNILETRAHKINDEERIPAIKNWLGMEGLMLLETFTQEEKEKCQTARGLFSVLSNRFRTVP